MVQTFSLLRYKTICKKSKKLICITQIIFSSVGNHCPILILNIFQVCKNHLWMLLATLKSGYNSGVNYQSLIGGHELINLETIENLIAQIERRESLEAIQRLFENRQFNKVIYTINVCEKKVRCRNLVNLSKERTIWDKYCM